MTDTAAAPARKVLGLRALFAASIGVIVAQLGMVAVLQGVGIGGSGFLIAMVIAFALALANALAYAEMALMMPSAGSLSSYAEAAIGSFPAILLVFAGYVTPALFGLPVELILAKQLLARLVPIVPAGVWPVLIVAVFAALNVLGTDIFAKVQTALSLLVLTFLLITGLTALTHHGVQPLPAAQGGWHALSVQPATVGVLALAFWVFVGSEFVTPLVEEARHPNRDLPRAMLWGLVIIFVAELLFAFGASYYVPRSDLISSPAPHLLYVERVFGQSADWWFGALALLSTASLMNTDFAAVPRMIWGMAMNGQVFPVLRRLHPRYRTPVIAILFVAALPLIGYALSRGDPDAILPLTVAASVSWILAYIMAQVSLIVLRYRHPGLHRPFRVPLFPWLPLAAIAGMIFVIWHSAPAPEMVPQVARYTGFVLLLFAIVGAIWVKGVMRLGLFQPTLPASLQGRLDIAGDSR